MCMKTFPVRGYFQVPRRARRFANVSARVTCNMHPSLVRGAAAVSQYTAKSQHNSSSCVSVRVYTMVCCI